MLAFRVRAKSFETSRERETQAMVETIMPDWRPGLLGTHTLNASDRVEVIDGLRFGG